MFIYDNFSKLEDNNNEGLALTPLAYVVLDCAR